jgi:hypothetical protein
VLTAILLQIGEIFGISADTPGQQILLGKKIGKVQIFSIISNFSNIFPNFFDNFQLFQYFSKFYRDFYGKLQNLVKNTKFPVNYKNFDVTSLYIRFLF